MYVTNFNLFLGCIVCKNLCIEVVKLSNKRKRTKCTKKYQIWCFPFKCGVCFLFCQKSCLLQCNFYSLNHKKFSVGWTVDVVLRTGLSSSSAYVLIQRVKDAAEYNVLYVYTSNDIIKVNLWWKFEFLTRG